MTACRPEGGRVPLLGRRVLVAEDEALLAMTLEDDLRGAGAEVVLPYADLEEALARVAAPCHGPIDAAVLDLALGPRSSLPLADALETRGVPVVFATGYGAVEGRPRSAVLGKPFASEELVAALAAALAGGPAAVRRPPGAS